MFAEIIELARQSDYDFRVTASPNDQLSYLFDEWVPYYRRKWAIARYLQPARILEIGVRYGYSAFAFLNAWPSAQYVGIDLDSDAYGGTKGAISWARKLSSGYAANFIIADSQNFDRFPGGVYDLIHIDGQQDYAGFVHDLGVAVGQARNILVDGYFWTRDNFLSGSEFLFRNNDLIEYYGVIPGYAGDLLIVTREGKAPPGRLATSSTQIRASYTSAYYLGDCGGFDSFKRTQGVKLEDSRLRTVAQLASLAAPGRALDLGCGRGELSIALARAGFDTTGVDYSADAISLARTAKIATGDPSLKATFTCSDLLTVPLQGTYDVIVAADVIEHLAPAELDKLYQRMASYLSPDGVFVIHTFPNAWYYQYEYARRSRIARSVGAYLPPDPRSRYEQLMHINEQSPRVLRKQLQRYFPYVLMWFSDHDMSNPYENLQRKFSIREMRASGDLFAIAAKYPLNGATLAREFRMEPATSISSGDLMIEVLGAPSSVRAGSHFTVDLYTKNCSDTPLRSCPPNPVHLSYHWIEAASARIAVFDGERTALVPALAARSEQRYHLFVRAPMQRSKYCVRMTLVQEGVRWLDAPPIGVFTDIQIDIT